MGIESTRSIPARAALLLLAVLALSACGNDEGDEDTGTAVAAASAAAAGSTSSASFCQAAAQVKSLELTARQAMSYSPPDKVKAAVDALLAAFPSYEASAPAKIKDAVTSVSGANRSYFEALQAAGYVFTKMEPNAAEALDNPGGDQGVERDRHLRHQELSCDRVT